MSTPILVVDASREFGILIRQSLQEEGDYRVSLVHSGQEAIEAAAGGKFELALIDFGLPDIPGSELVRQLHQIDPELPIIAIPMAGSSDELAGLNLSAVLTKPFYLPDLPQILKKAQNQQSFRNNWIQWEQPEEQKARPPTAARLKKETPTEEQAKPKSIEEAIVEINLPTDLLEQGTEKIAAIGSLLWNGEQAVHQAGLSRGQLSSLASTLLDMGGQIQTKRAVTQYVQIPDAEEDLLLFASPWKKGLTLVTLYPAKTAFGQVRKSNAELAQFLRDHSPGSQESASLESQAADQPTPVRMDKNDLPADWVPDDELSSTQRAMLEELAALDPPPADPARFAQEIKHKPIQAQLPKDWIPSRRASPAVQAMLEDMIEPATETSESQAPEKTTGHLSYYIVLLPRFPDHPIDPSLAEKVDTWVHRICLAWDWRALHVEQTKGVLLLEIQLNAESAPADAVKRIKVDLSRRILAEKPDWAPALPSGRFFTSNHLLTAGTKPTQNQLSQFIRQTRQAQGLTSQ